MHLIKKSIATLCLVSIFSFSSSYAQSTAIKDYPTLKQSQNTIKLLASHKNIAVTNITKTTQGTPVQLITVSDGKPSSNPAILILGNVSATDHAASQITINLATKLANNKELLKNTTFYIIPQPSPDALSGFQNKPYHNGNTNLRPFDDDKDFSIDEDGPEDLNGDGLITMMRIEDATGKHILHPDDNRVLVLADAKKNQTPTHRLLTEGIDNDKDEKFNEDPKGGTAFNKNHTYNYGFFQSGAGPHQVSEPETRAIVEFAYTHNNIFAVYSFSGQDNLHKPWSSGKNSKFPSKVETTDATYFTEISKSYNKIFKDDATTSFTNEKGNFAQWAYFHFGRWSYTAPSYSPNLTKPDAKKKDSKVKHTESKTDQKSEKPEKKKKKKTTPNQHTKLLNYMDKNNIDGFVNWTKYDHPDFPGKLVEIGGFKPFTPYQPKFSQIANITDQNEKFIEKIAATRPNLKFLEPKIESLGENVYRVTITLQNAGKLPTLSAMGQRTNRLQVLQLKTITPQGIKFITGKKRDRLNRINPQEKIVKVYTFSLPKDAAKTFSVKAWSPSVGVVTQTVNLTEVNK